MNISDTNKKIIIFGAFFVLFTVIVGVVFRFEGKEETVAEDGYIIGYEIKDSSSGRLLENEKAGFSLLIPENWIVKDYDYKANLLSSELKYNIGVNPINQAEADKICMVNAQIAKYKENSQELTNFSSLMEEVEKGKKGEGESLVYSLLNVEGRVFLVSTFKKDGKTVHISAKNRDGNRIYFIDSGLVFSEDCVESFNNILQTVKIW